MGTIRKLLPRVLFGAAIVGMAGAQAQTNLSYPGGTAYGNAISTDMNTWHGLDRWDAIYALTGEGSGSVAVWHQTGRVGNQINFMGTCWNSSGCQIDASGWMTPTHQHLDYYGFHNAIFAGPLDAYGANPWPPIVASVGGVSNLTASSATFNGWLDSTGSAATAVFVCWGATDRGKTMAGWDTVVNFGVRTQGEYVSTSVSGLNRSITYYYRFCATNAAGSAWSDPAVQFKPASAPAISNGGVTNIAPESALLMGDVTAGGNANVTVYWGSVDGGTTPSIWQHAIGLGALNEGAFAGGVAGLTPGATYYYRCCAANSVGTGWAGATSSFQAMPEIPNAWLGRMKITFRGYTKTEALTNFPALIVLNESISGFQYSQFATPGGGDLRFTDANFVEVPYEVESWNPSGNSYLWVNVPQVVDSNSCIWAFWNKSGAVVPAYTTNGATWTHSAAVWHMNQPDALDSSGNGNNGAASGTVTSASSSLTGGADQFGGSGYVCVPESLTTRTHTNGLTISFWLKNDLGGYALSRLGYVPYPSQVSPLATPITGFCESGNWAFGQGYAPANIGYLTVGSGRPDSGSAWHQYAVVYDSVYHVPFWSVFPHSYGIVHAYRDGVWIGDTGNNGSGGTIFQACYGDADSLCLGANNLDKSSRLNGTMDEVRMENAVRSVNWLWAAYMTMASNAAFSSYAPVQTLSAPAVDNGGGATSIGTLSARLGGSLTAGGSASAIVYWGTTDGGTTPGNWQHTNSVGGVGQGTFGYDLNGLTPGTQYYYRYYAANACGTAWADSTATFATLPMPFEAWACRMKIQFSGYTLNQPLTNFPALVVFGTNLANFAYNQFASPAAYDLRFVDATGMTPLNYEIEKWNTNGQSFVWVQVPVLRSSADYIWAYWGNSAAATQQPSTTNGSVWDASFKAVWHLSANTPNITDSTANHVNGTPYNDTNVVGIADGAQGFGGSAYVDLGGVLAPGSGFTLESWVSSSSSGPIIKRRNPWPGATENLGYDLEMGSQPSISLWQESSQSTKTAISGTGGYNDSKWHHVVGIWDGGNLSLYVDGIQRGSLGGVGAPRDGSVVNMARDPWTYSGLAAQLDEMRFSSLARSSNWIWATYMTVAANSAFSAYAGVTQGGASVTTTTTPETSTTTLTTVTTASTTTTTAASMTTTTVTTTSTTTTQASGTLTIQFNGAWYSSPYTVGAGTYTMTGIQVQGPSSLLTQSGGSVTVNGQLLMKDGGGTVTYDLSGGSLSVTAGEPYWLDASGGITALMKVSGTAQFTFGGGNAYLGNWGGGGSATLDVSGSATVSYTGGQFQMGVSNSYLRVTGGNCAISLVNVRTDGHSIGGLTYTVTAGGSNISPIVTTGGDLDLSGSMGTIHLATAGFAPTVGQTFDLIKIPASGTILVPGAGTNALLNADSAANWSLSVVTAGGNQILRATALTGGGPSSRTVHGIPYAWLTDHGLTNLNDSVEAEDPDGDGANNLQEYIAGTDPTNHASVLAMKDVQGRPGGSPAIVRWASASNKFYALWSTLDLRSGFSIVQSNIAATPVLNTYTDVWVTPPAQKFYRIEVQRP